MSETTGLQMDAKSLAELKTEWVALEAATEAMGKTSVDDHEAMKQAMLAVGHAAIPIIVDVPRLLHDYELLLALGTAIATYWQAQADAKQGPQAAGFSQALIDMAQGERKISAALRACGMGEVTQ